MKGLQMPEENQPLVFLKEVLDSIIEPTLSRKLRGSTKDRFLSKVMVIESGCIEWIGSL